MKFTCTLVSVLYLCTFLHLEESSLILKRHPYGHIMCKLLGERTVGCTYYTFDPIKLLCQEWTGTLQPTAPPPTVEIKIIQNKENTVPSWNCPVSSTIIQSLRKPEHCVKRVDSCPKDGYHLLRRLRLCYKRHTQYQSWTTARAVCQGEGGDLISLNTRKKYRRLKSIIAKLYPRKMVYRVWVGMTRSSRKSYAWLTGTTSFVKWSPSDPNYGNESCIMLKPFGLADTHCHYGYEFVCEIDPL